MHFTRLILARMAELYVLFESFFTFSTFQLYLKNLFKFFTFWSTTSLNESRITIYPITTPSRHIIYTTAQLPENNDTMTEMLRLVTRVHQSILNMTMTSDVIDSKMTAS